MCFLMQFDFRIFVHNTRHLNYVKGKQNSARKVRIGFISPSDLDLTFKEIWDTSVKQMHILFVSVFLKDTVP